MHDGVRRRVRQEAAEVAATEQADRGRADGGRDMHGRCVVRDDQEFVRAINYVLNNPVKAGLATGWRAWQWNYCAPTLVEAGVVT